MSENYGGSSHGNRRYSIPTDTLTLTTIAAIRDHCYDSLSKFWERHLADAMSYHVFLNAMNGKSIKMTTVKEIEFQCQLLGITKPDGSSSDEYIARDIMRQVVVEATYFKEIVQSVQACLQNVIESVTAVNQAVSTAMTSFDRLYETAWSTNRITHFRDHDVYQAVAVLKQVEAQRSGQIQDDSTNNP